MTGRRPIASRERLFELSRDPLADLGREDEHTLGAATWFERTGGAALRRFAARLQGHPAVRDVQIADDAHRSRDALGVGFRCSLTLSISLRSGPTLFARGDGQARYATAARWVALAESIERLAMDLDNLAEPIREVMQIEREARPGKINSNGASFHSSATQVVKGAICELLERDALLSRWYAGATLPVTVITAEHPLHLPAKRLAEQGWDLNENIWVHDKVPAACVSLALVRRRPLHNQWNFFLGGAAAPTCTDARARAFNEATRLFRNFHAESFGVDTSCRVRPSFLRTPLSRLFLYQRPWFIAKYRERLVPDSIGNDAAAQIHAMSDTTFVRTALTRLGTLQIVRLPLPSPFAPHTYCIKATCPELQDLDWGIPPSVNRGRLRGLFGLRRATPRTLPHPIA
jgi:hypothetical protein